MFGLFRPTVLLPAAALTALTPRERAMTLCHELAHVRRLDLAFAWAPAVMERLLFFHPGARLAAREYAFAREAACDADVLQHLGEAPRDYGRLLLRLGVTRRPAALAAAQSSPSTRMLRRRLALLNDHEPSPRAGRGLWLAGALLLPLALPLSLVAGQSDQPPAPPTPPAPAAAGPPAPPAPPAPFDAARCHRRRRHRPRPHGSRHRPPASVAASAEVSAPVSAEASAPASAEASALASAEVSEAASEAVSAPTNRRRLRPRHHRRAGRAKTPPPPPPPPPPPADMAWIGQWPRDVGAARWRRHVGLLGLVEGRRGSAPPARLRRRTVPLRPHGRQHLRLTRSAR